MRGKEKSIEKQKIELVRDFTYLQDKAGLEYIEQLEEEDTLIDWDVLHLVSGDRTNTCDLNSLKLDLWTTYTEAILNQIEGLIKDLVRNFAEVKDSNKQFSSLRREYDHIWEKENNITKKQFLNEIKKLFKKSSEFYFKLKDEEKILRKEGREKFLSSYYPKYATFFSAIYLAIFVGIYTVTSINILVLIGGGIVGWIIILTICYYFTCWLFRKGI